ncbi:MAG: type II toxin-antitoxin system VapC family toxin [bacterium]|nr:type II toxin-antitoxin system VapC family toxin [bacterium]
MRDYLLDTQMIRYWYDTECPEHTAVVGNVRALRKLAASAEHQPRLRASVITLGEIEFGHRVQPEDHATEQAAYLGFVNEQLPNCLGLTEDAVTAYGELRARLFNKYAPGEKRKPKMRPEQLPDPISSIHLQIQENDLWLCAQAVGHELVLVTNDAMKPIMNIAEGMTPPLRVQDWTMLGAVTRQ